MSADQVRDWMRARQLADRLKRESFAASSLTAAESFGAACGLMDLASRFRVVADGPDVVRERDERASREAWMLLHARDPVGRG
jgi:hypothetical protein